jgi:LacI family transcriptional regulator
MHSGPVSPTLDDVAKAAGVSTATVSRCLNMPQKVSGKTRERVMRAVEELGYTPHFGARVMASKRSFTIGAIIPTMENAIFARGLQTFQEELHRLGYTLLVSSTAYQPAAEAEQIRSLIARGADGLLLIGAARDAAVYDMLRQRDVPALLSWVFTQEGDPPCVGFDNRASMRALAEKVIEYGHRDIAVIAGVTEGNDRAAERVAGIGDVLAAHGLTSPPRVIEAPYTIEAGGAAFARLMRDAPRPSVVMCGNDVLAVGAIKQAHQMGLRVPQDVSVTGFDDIELARIVTPELTTVHVPHQEMGRRAAQELIRMVEGEGRGDSVNLTTTVKLRGSLAAR